MSSLIARCKANAGGFGVVGLSLLSASSAMAAPPAKGGAKDAEALELAKKAIYTDYLGTKFPLGVRTVVASP